jgi:DNA-binding response OmpR family regulator
MSQAASTVLVIDDHVALAQGFARGLSIAGYAVHVATRADIALQLALEHPPDAIILDFNMPFVNGVGFLYRLRNLRSFEHTPVLVITAESLTDDIRATIRSLDAHVREKPIRLDDLIQATRMMVEHGRQN